MRARSIDADRQRSNRPSDGARVRSESPVITRASHHRGYPAEPTGRLPGDSLAAPMRGDGLPRCGEAGQQASRTSYGSGGWHRLRYRRSTTPR
jgi:hypothetical protein